MPQQMVAHESARTTNLYDRRGDEISLDEAQRIAICGRNSSAGSAPPRFSFPPRGLSVCLAGPKGDLLDNKKLLAVIGGFLNGLR